MEEDLGAQDMAGILGEGRGTWYLRPRGKAQALWREMEISNGNVGLLQAVS